MDSKTKISVHPLVTKRRSIVSFSGGKIPEEDLMRLFEAAKWAPSSFNIQPWRFLYAMKENEEEFSKFFSVLNESNSEWAGSASVLALSVAETISEGRERPNRFAFHDLGMAVGNLLLQATYMGLYVHQMGGYDTEKARQVFDIPENFEPGAMIAIGYRGEIDNLPVNLRRKELAIRKRKDINDFVYKGGWKSENS